MKKSSSRTIQNLPYFMYTKNQFPNWKILKQHFNSYGQPRATSEQPRTSETPINDTQMTSLSPRMSNLTSAKNGLERPPAASLRPRPRPRKHAPRNRDVKRASHTKYELIWMSGTCSNRILLLQKPRGRNAKMRLSHTIWPTKSENNYFS